MGIARFVAQRGHGFESKYNLHIYIYTGRSEQIASCIEKLSGNTNAIRPYV